MPSGRLLRCEDWTIPSKFPDIDPTRKWDQTKPLSDEQVAFVDKRRGVLSPDGELLAVGLGNRRNVELWDFKARKQVRTLIDGSNSWLSIDRLEFSPDGKLLVAANSVRIREQFVAAVLVWDVHTGELRHRFSVPGMFPQTFAISPNGQLVAAAGPVSLHVWDLVTGKPAGPPISGHEGSILTVAYSSDSNRIITASEDFSCRVWDAHSGREIFKLNHRNAVTRRDLAERETHRNRKLG